MSYFLSNTVFILTAGYSLLLIQRTLINEAAVGLIYPWSSTFCTCELDCPVHQNEYVILLLMSAGSLKLEAGLYFLKTWLLFFNII